MKTPREDGVGAGTRRFSGDTTGVSRGVSEGVSGTPSAGVLVGVSLVPLSSILRAAAWTWMMRSRSADIASATWARVSASTSFKRSSSTSFEGVPAGVITGGVRGGSTGDVIGFSGGVSLAGVVPDRYPRDTKAGIGICHPLSVIFVPAATS